MSSLKAKENDICCSLRFFSNCQMEKTMSTFDPSARKLNALQASRCGSSWNEEIFFDDGQKTEISISAAGYFSEMKKTETPSKRRRVGRYAIAIADRHNARNDFSRRYRLYYQVSTVAVPWLLFIQTRGPLAACLLNEYVLSFFLFKMWGRQFVYSSWCHTLGTDLVIQYTVVITNY